MARPSGSVHVHVTVPPAYTPVSCVTSGGADPNGGNYLAERGAVVTHNGKTFIIEGIALDKSSQPTVSEEGFNAFLKGIVWTD